MQPRDFAWNKNSCVMFVPLTGNMDMTTTKQGKAKVAAFLAGFGVVLATSAASAHAASAQMMVAGRTSQPIGHYEYCKINRADCSLVSRSTRPVKLTRERWADLVEINDFANNTVTPVTDLEYYGVEEHWVQPGRYGDCEDYALMKRRMLMARGWPASSLLITVVRQPNGDGHAVLTVRTDRADYVLDNLEHRILQWNETEYTFLKRQAASHSGQWEDIVDSRGLVGSVR